MKRRRQIQVFVSLGVLITAAAFIALRPREPVYQGKHLSEWLREFDNERANAGHRRVEEAVRAMGTDCLPILIRELRAQDSPLLKKLVGLASRQHWPKFSYTERWTRWARAVSGFQALGQRAVPAIPALIQMLNRGESDRYELHNWGVGAALNAVGPAAAKAVAQLLTNRNIEVRYRAVEILSGFRADDAREAIPELMQCIKTDNQLSFRNHAALCLEQIAHGDPDVLVPIYIVRLADPNRYPRLNAASALGKLGNQAKASVPALLSALNDPSERVRLHAESALKLVDPQAAAKAGVK